MLQILSRTQSRLATSAFSRIVETVPCAYTAYRELISLQSFRHFTSSVADIADAHISNPSSSSIPTSSSTHARILDGRAIAATWEDELALEVADIKSRGGRPPGLGVILVGDRPDSLLYVSRKQEACERIGMHSVFRQFSSSISQVALRRAVVALCADPSVDGVLVQLPLPGHIDEEDIIEHFDPGKDVDGFHPLNVGRTLMRGRSARFVPCTALGCVELLRRSNIEIHGKSIAIVGDSNIVGMPLAMLFRDEGAATVTVVHRSSYSSLFSGGSLAAAAGSSAAHPVEPQTDSKASEIESGSSSVGIPREDADAARRRAEANACLPHTPGPIYSSNSNQSSSSSSSAPSSSESSSSHHRELQPYQVTYSSGMRDAYLPPTQSNFEDPASVPSHLAELAGITRTADILVVAVGYPHLVKEDWIKPGAVVIDVGINVVDWDYHPHHLPQSTSTTADSTEEEQAHFHVVGDVDFNQAVRVASALTPVPGGVGPMTIAALLHNTVRAAAVKMGLRNETSTTSSSCEISHKSTAAE